MVLTMLAERRNSPSSGRPSTSSRTVWFRLPCATAAMARVTSVVGRRRSSTSVLTETSISPQAPFAVAEARALTGAALFADGLSNALQFLGHLFVGSDDVIEGVGDLSRQAGPRSRQTNGEVALLHPLQAGQNDSQFGGSRFPGGVDLSVSISRYFGDGRGTGFGCGTCFSLLHLMDLPGGSGRTVR